MPDARLQWHNLYGGYADLALLGDGQLDTTQDLATAVIVSLFSDRLAARSDKLNYTEDNRRGWWGDTDLQDDHPGDLLGSRLWLLQRRKSDNHLPLIARGYIIEALQWMIDDGVAAKVEATCYFLRGDQSKLGAVVTITRHGQRPVDLSFDWAWQETGIAASVPSFTAPLSIGIELPGGAVLTTESGVVITPV